MGRPLLKQIKLKAFRSFAEPVTIDFPDAGMVLFRGRSGSGKSSLLLAIQYLLGICPYPATVLQSWLTEEPMEVQGTIKMDDGDLVITRGQKLSATMASVPLKGSAKEIEQKIHKQIGLTPELLAALTYRGQRQPGLFLSMTDSEKKEFLTTLLDLGKFEKAADESQTKTKGLEVQAAAAALYLEAMRTDAKFVAQNVTAPVLNSMQKMEADLAEAREKNTKLESRIVSLRLRLKTAKETVESGAQLHVAPMLAGLKKIENQLVEMLEAGFVPEVDETKLRAAEADLAQAHRFLAEEVARDQERKAEQSASANAIYAQIVTLEKQLAGYAGIERETTRLTNEMDKLSRSLCDRCMRPWDEALARKEQLAVERIQLNTQKQQLEALRPTVAELQAKYRVAANFVQSAEVAELQRLCMDLTQAVERERGEINAQQREQTAQFQQHAAEAEAAIERRRTEIGREVECFRANGLLSLEAVEGELENLENEAKMTRASVSALEAAVARVSMDNAREEERVRVAQERLAKALAAVAEAEAKHAGIMKSISAELDFQRLIGREGFLGSIFDEVLWEISEETNRILAQFPNTSHVTLNFRSESTTQKGSIKKSITPVVTVGGFEAPLLSGLSGGMLTATELAVDIAVGNVVSRRTGVVPGWVVLDESFEGLGPSEKEASMEILRVYGAEKLVLVVDHASEFKEMFSQFIDVKCDGGVSRVVEAA